jgi:hypothetical protein
MANCPVFQELKDTGCGPPVLQHLFQQAGLLSDAEPGEDSQDKSSGEEEK